MQRLNFIKDIVFWPIQIDRASCVLAHKINNFYKDSDEDVIVLVVLNGAEKFANFLFSKDWLGTYDKFEVYHITASSYKDNKKLPNNEIYIDFSGDVEIVKNKRVLIVDDIYDSGNTLDKITKEVKKHNPKDVQCAVLLERNKHDICVDVEFVGLKVDTDDFLVGYGLDFDGGYRDLPYIASIKTEKDEYWDPVTKNIREICFCNKCGVLCCKSLCSVLDDYVVFEFNLCGKCLKEISNNFKLPVDWFEQEYKKFPWDEGYEV